MLQRKQTLYLLLSALLMIVALFVQLGRFSTTFGTITMTSQGFTGVDGSLITSTYPLLLLGIVAAGLTLFSIMLFKGRPLQMRFVMFALILKLGFAGTAYFLYSRTIFEGVIAQSITPWMFAFPLTAAILDYLAYAAIAIDERRVRFMRRLR